MKRFLFPLILISLFVGLSSGEELPSDVQRLFGKRNEAIAKIDRTFVNELEKLKVKYTKKGDLDSANAIVTLIEQFRIEEDDPDPLSEVFGKTFSWSANGKDAGNRLIVLEGGKATMRGNKITWEKLGEREIRITFSSGNKATIQWSADYKSFAGRETLRRQKITGKLVE